MERSLTSGRRPWWMTTYGREPMGDIWSDRLWPEWPRQQGEEYRPSVDLYEEDGKYFLTAELPGVQKDDINITVEGNVVSLSGKKSSKREKKEANYYFSESSWGAFSRSFRLPENVDENNVDARFKDGVLTLELPVKESEKTRKIDIKT
jgi:HSP20 family protein